MTRWVSPNKRKQNGSWCEKGMNMAFVSDNKAISPFETAYVGEHHMVGHKEKSKNRNAYEGVSNAEVFGRK